jgi:hypothetical protein
VLTQEPTYCLSIGIDRSNDLGRNRFNGSNVVRIRNLETGLQNTRGQVYTCGFSTLRELSSWLTQVGGQIGFAMDLPGLCDSADGHGDIQ